MYFVNPFTKCKNGGYFENLTSENGELPILVVDIDGGSRHIIVWIKFIIPIYWSAPK
jgi:hypothetical protein